MYSSYKRLLFGFFLYEWYDLILVFIAFFIFFLYLFVYLIYFYLFIWSSDNFLLLQILEGFKTPVEDSTMITPDLLPESRTLSLNAQATVPYENYFER